MGDDENRLSAKRPSKKRTSVVSSPQPLTAKKRVVLGEITNSQNFGLCRDSDFAPEKMISMTVGKEEENHEPSKAEIDGSSTDHSLKCDQPTGLYKYLRAQEMKVDRRPLPNYMELVQNDVAPFMREILVDWLVEVAEEYKLVQDTIYLTVSYIDRFLSHRTINKNKMQLLGVSCMFIASKHEEISPIHVEDFCYVTDNTYTKEELLDTEQDVLKLLNFERGTPTTKTFLRIFMGIGEENSTSSKLKFELLGSYLAELSLLDYRCVSFLPSIIAASAVFLSRLTIEPMMHPWSLALQNRSGYTPSDLKECIPAIHDLQLNRKKSSLKAIREKYTKNKYMSVATLTPPSEIPAHYFEPING